MAKIFNYTMILAGLLVLLNMAGIGGTSALAQYFNFSSAWGLSPIAIAIVGIIGAWGIAGTIAGLFGRSAPESTVVGAIALSLLTLSLGDMYLIYQQMNSYCGAGSICAPLSSIVLLLFTVLNVGYLIAIVQWWRGNDIS